MANEIEAKVRVRDFAAVRRALTGVGAEYLGTAIETDQFFDRPDASLRKADCGLRLRIIRVVEKWGQAPFSQRQQREKGASPHFPPLLTYKGPRKAGLSLKVRREVQTHVEDARAMTQLLAALGFAPTAVVRKRRSSYRVGSCQVELDELRGIGRFVEVEGPSRRQVEAVCKQLDLQGERVTRSYVSMVAGCC